MSPSHLLKHLLALTAENEVVEFKEAKNSYDFTKLGKYFSALSNEANLKHQKSAWLVFGVHDKKQVVGSHKRMNTEKFMRKTHLFYEKSTPEMAVCLENSDEFYPEHAENYERTKLIQIAAL